MNDRRRTPVRHFTTCASSVSLSCRGGSTTNTSEVLLQHFWELLVVARPLRQLEAVSWLLLLVEKEIATLSACVIRHLSFLKIRVIICLTCIVIENIRIIVVVLWLYSRRTAITITLKKHPCIHRATTGRGWRIPNCSKLHMVWGSRWRIFVLDTFNVGPCLVERTWV